MREMIGQKKMFHDTIYSGGNVCMRLWNNDDGDNDNAEDGVSIDGEGDNDGDGHNDS